MTAQVRLLAGAREEVRGGAVYSARILLDRLVEQACVFARRDILLN